jgi:hypothetical protein
MEQEYDREFTSLINDAYWMEAHLEFFNEFIAALKVKNPKYKEVIKQISEDSHQHKEMLNELISNINFLDLERIQTESGRKSADMDLDIMSEENIMKTLLENENKIHGFYQQLYNSADRTMLEQVWMGNNIDEFYQTIQHLINWEQRHIELVEKAINQNSQ